MMLGYSKILLVCRESFSIVPQEKVEMSKFNKGFGFNCKPTPALLVVVSIIRFLLLSLLKIRLIYLLIYLVGKLLRWLLINK